MSYERNHTAVDWWSRLMALGSLLVAAAAVWFIKFNAPQTPVAGSTEIQKLVNELGEKTTAHAAQLEQIKLLESRIASLEAGGVKTAGVETPITDRLPADPPGDAPGEDNGDDDKFDEYFSADGSNEDSSDDETPATNTTANSDDDNEADENGLKLGAMSDDSSEDDESILRVVQTSLRPYDDEYSVTMTLRNTSDIPAIISKVIFTPKDIVEDVPTELAVKPLGKSTETEFVMAFGAEHNQSRGTGRKGQYVKLLNDRFTVDPGEEISVRMGITDPEHIGYGLLGSLELEYNTTESLNVPSLALAFLGEEK